MRLTKLSLLLLTLIFQSCSSLLSVNESHKEENEVLLLLGDVKKLSSNARKGDISAQFNLGLCYYNGKDVEKDLNQAVYWFRKAAEQGNASAQSKLGMCYFKGEGVTKNSNLALYWFRMAAEQGKSNQGDASAQCGLGDCYYYGEGVSRNYKQAVYWYQKAAEQGYAEAQCKLGDLYYKGEGVYKNLKEAEYWYQKAAKQGYTNAQNKQEKLLADNPIHNKVLGLTVGASTKRDVKSRFYYEGNFTEDDDILVFTPRHQVYFAGYYWDEIYFAFFNNTLLTISLQKNEKVNQNFESLSLDLSKYNIYYKEKGNNYIIYEDGKTKIMCYLLNRNYRYYLRLAYTDLRLLNQKENNGIDDL